MKEDNEQYHDFLQQAVQDFNGEHALSDDKQQHIIRKGKYTATKKNIMVSLAILLLVVPIMTLSSYFYYAVGGKANHLIDVATSTVYVTEPNMSIEPMKIESDIGFFSMNILFDVFKKIGRENYKVGHYAIDFAFDKPAFPKRNIVVDRPLPNIPSIETETLFHPEAPIPSALHSQWAILDGLPDGTVAEVYVSLAETMTQKEVEQLFGPTIDVRWVAVDTGMEGGQLDARGIPITALGYPAQIDYTTWSPFNGREQTNEQIFMDILRLLEKNEAVAVKIARAKSLALPERISYIDNHGVRIYAAVVTGSTAELRKMQEIQKVRAIKVGEVKLWN